VRVAEEARPRWRGGVVVGEERVERRVGIPGRGVGRLLLRSSRRRRWGVGPRRGGGAYPEFVYVLLV